MAATLLVHYPNVAKLLRGKGGAVLVVALLAIILRSVSTAYDAGAAPLFFGVFFVVACGNTMFGLLTSRPVRLLGMVSYSIYLSHNFVLYLTFKAINHFNDVSALTVPAFWGVTAAASVLIVILSALTYRYIEYPFLKGSISKQRSCVEVDQSIHA
ncbi:acyltransferase family protein [Burkholderia multivorans]|uniref:acyltransferase family protein n=1 Tax=Burkholderia multivorans TaxID=87883 RepID=UPI002018CD34|nr:acyltransferase family protein [Burkholderia multivorans]MCO1352355.1 acyltransferase family protein [Burkholderia multivorans]UQP46440.1 acyltransferase family protein [Burkholderia multivorans]